VVGEHGEHPAVAVLRLRESQLAEDGADMRFDGLLGNPELLGDRRVRLAFGDDREDPGSRRRMSRGAT
jgi:hypothetical protein